MLETSQNKSVQQQMGTLHPIVNSVLKGTH